MRSRSLAVGLVGLLGLMLAACGGDDIADVVAAEAVAAAGDVEVPPRDADLAPAGWPATAAWIAREAEAKRPVVMNLFASWCGPCEDEAPALRAVALDLPEVAFLGVDHQDLLKDGRAFVDEYDLPFPTLFDIGGEVARAIGSTGMPTTAFFDRDGRLVDLHVGPLSEEQLRDRIEDLGLLVGP